MVKLVARWINKKAVDLLPITKLGSRLQDFQQIVLILTNSEGQSFIRGTRWFNLIILLRLV